MAILGQLSASINTSKRVSIEAGHKDTEREKSYSSFIHQGKPICKAMFCFIHAIDEKRVKNPTCSLKENGLTARIHGNTKRKPKHAFSCESIEFLVKFIFIIQSSMPYFFLAVFPITSALTSSYCHQVTPNGQSGECTEKQQNKVVPFILLHTAALPFCGGN